MRPANELGVAETADAICSGVLRSVDVVQACLDRIAAREDQVGAWVHLDARSAMEVARQRDRESPRGLLHGVPLAVKDIIDTVDMPTACGSPIYANRRPASDAACVALVKRAGAVILGKTVTTEFAYFALGRTANPQRVSHTPGGSSSGSAAAVADRMVMGAFGTQTAASLTRPASFCGVVGYKPSFADFCLAGIKGLAESFDTLGTITRNVVDARWLRQVLVDENRHPGTIDGVRAPKIGVCRTPWWHCADVDTQNAIEQTARRLSMAGASVHDVELPEGFLNLAERHATIMAYEAARSLAYEYDVHRAQLSEPLVRLIEDGQATNRRQYLNARDEAKQACLQFGAWMKSCDVVLAPSAKGEAPQGLGATGDPLFSRMWTLLRVPSITIPGMVGKTGLPVGVQLIGALGDDERLLEWAQWCETIISADTSCPGKLQHPVRSGPLLGSNR